MIEHIKGTFSIDKFKEKQEKLFVEWEKEIKKHKELTQEDLKDLQEKLVNTCVEFLKERDIFNVEEVHLTIDGMYDSIKFGYWTPSTDSYISAYKKSLTESGIIGLEKIGEYA